MPVCSSHLFARSLHSPRCTLTSWGSSVWECACVSVCKLLKNRHIWNGKCSPLGSWLSGRLPSAILIYTYTYSHAHTHAHTLYSDDTTWCGQYVRAMHNLAFEPVTIIGSMKKKCCREDMLWMRNNFKTVSLPWLPWKSKRDKYIPKALISSCSVPPLYCTSIFLLCVLT